MKKRGLLALLVLTILQIPLFPSSAFAASSVTITSTAHRHFDGVFINDQLAEDLKPSGKFGELIYSPVNNVSTWRLDPAFIEEIQAMSLGYQVAGMGEGAGKDVASAWLQRLNQVISGRRVEAIAYANPSEYWINKLMPHDRGFVLSVSAVRLTDLLHHFVYPPTQYDSVRYFSLQRSHVRLVNISTARIQASAAYLDSQLLENYKLAEVKFLSSKLSSTQRQTFAYDLAVQINTLRNSIRISSGKFTITSTNQKLPITLTNDFPKPVRVNLVIRSTNERIFVQDVPRVLIPAKSKVQVMVPIKVFTSGDSGFVVEIKTEAGDVFGQSITYPLKIAVISPVATWITTIAAVVLFSAAIFQSLRRIRRGRKVHEHR